jgi:putative heme iron utilization protein
MAVVSAHLNGGFARAADLTAADVLTDISDAQALIEAESGAVVHMNADHAEACRLYATRLLGGPDGGWACVGIDPDGIDLQWGRHALRLGFPQRITGPGDLRAMLKQLADRARSPG